MRVIDIVDETIWSVVWNKWFYQTAKCVLAHEDFRVSHCIRIPSADNGSVPLFYFFFFL